ncbi:MAG TPA: membrane protein insertase YidC [Oxalobacteraceae bacterium]|nr:membrane protein insertase YidC [Oxalobacteraceae bacterium]
MDIQRTVLWVVFSLSLLFLWDKWMVNTGKPSMFFPTATQQAKPVTGAAGSASGSAVADVPQASATAAGVATPTAAAVPAAAAAAPTHGETITITTDLVKADIDTAGGVLKRLELLQQKEGKENIKHEWYDPFLELVGRKQKVIVDKNVVMFDSNAESTYLAESGLIGGPFPNHKSLFIAKPGPRVLDGANEISLVLEAEENGVKLVKTYTFRRGDYTIGLKNEVVNGSAAPIAPTLYVQLVRDGNMPEGTTKFSRTFTGPAVYTDADKFQKLTFENIAKGKAEHATKADNGWVAMVQHYFVSALVPPEKAPREIFTDKVAANLYAVGTKLPLGTIAPGATRNMDVKLYSGPQESALLDKVDPSLELVKDYGMFTIIAKPIFWLLEQIHKVLGNWGWTIIVFTILMKLAFFPLSAASYRSMGKMKQVTPKMTAIRERYKADPQKMNQAMMELYKTEKINPLGGCLPILIQMPVFIALYWVLLAVVEMRNAPWLGWIQDLASPDPYFILPVLMAVSMFIQTKLNPKPPDPMQAKVMMFMPLIFSAMFFFFPSGLVLYYVVNNVLSITQQWVITKKLEAGKPA